ncbi:hypothetical protein M9H77_06237 [Catharanthus roseus]|uniref:Uncharacterized protein n=1 Tax=Catharanthus roseus TaxID=4058 RepID=A0ACC0BRS4_CATRO|nr:hypothetical protein M9H77_06237 [Catharanthus roseus]
MASRTSLAFLLFTFLMAISASYAHGFTVRVTFNQTSPTTATAEITGGPVVFPLGSTTPVAGGNVTILINLGPLRITANATTDINGNFNVVVPITINPGQLPNLLTVSAVANVALPITSNLPGTIGRQLLIPLSLQSIIPGILRIVLTLNASGVVVLGG